MVLIVLLNLIGSTSQAPAGSGFSFVTQDAFQYLVQSNGVYIIGTAA